MDDALTNGTLPPSLVESRQVTYAEFAVLLGRVEQIFAQTNWLCVQVQGIIATLPPPMQQALAAAIDAQNKEMDNGNQPASHSAG